MPIDKKIMVAMSGGVDSSVVAALLKQQGYEVHGVYMILAQPDAAEQVARVAKIAAHLEVQLTTLNLQEAFQEKVLRYFIDSYAAGRTPNPCVVCNPAIKFGEILAYGRQHGIRQMATGHYVRLARDMDGQVRLLKGSDPNKDQSYFLCQLSQEQIRHLCFPLGTTAKEKVYQLAAALGLGAMHSKESQDVCFLKNQNVQQFLAGHGAMAEQAGDIVTAAGQVLGRHKGIFRYTVGQRRGLGIPDSTPYYVTGLDAGNNQVIVGKEQELWCTELRVRKMNWTAGQEPPLPASCAVKIRYRHDPAPAAIEADADGYIVRFAVPQRAVTPGQFAVLYDGEELLGGGEIDKGGLS